MLESIGSTFIASIVSVVYLFLIAKLIGHRQMSQLGIFDYITGISIGSIAAEFATELESPEQPAVAMAVYAAFTITLNIITNRSARLRKAINGAPVVIMNDGKLFRANMKKSRLDLSEFLVMCRQAGYFDLAAIQTAVYECDGRLSILPAATRRPATPEDLDRCPKKETIFAEVIMDGRVMGENLKLMGKSEEWLLQEINKQGFQSPDEIFLGLCDDGGKITVYPVEA